MTDATHRLTLDCVHCGLCLPACPTYRVLGLEPDSPRGRVYLMRALAEGRIEDAEGIRSHLDLCLGCRACEGSCPSGVRYGEILEATRARIEKKSPRRGIAAWLARQILWRIVARQRRLRFAFAVLRFLQVTGLRRVAALLHLVPRAVERIAPPVPPARERRPLPAGVHSPKGPARGRVFLFTGCIMEPMFGGVNRATLRLLLENGFEVEIPEGQGCCGALLLHAGLDEEARILARRNVAAFAGEAAVVNNSAGCGAALKDYGRLLDDGEARAFSARCRDICEFLAEQGLAAEPAERRERVAYDDPCHLCHGQGIRQEPRDLLRRVPGLELVEHEKPEDCCGSAGIYNLLQEEMAEKIGRSKIDRILASKATMVATGNPGCMLQIAAHLRAVRSGIRVVHPVELLLPPP
ncbi:MAG: heterodisulfide reductase-related iron-sulfur binding cluster [Planctomycetota bacterium]